MSMFKKLSQVSIFSIYKKYQLYKLKGKGKRIIDHYFRSHAKVKLHIGAGGSILDSWLNVDIAPLDERIAYFDATVPFPFKMDSVDFIFSEHVIEHLDLEGQINMLNESYRVLKPGGIIRIATPNLDKILDIRTTNNSFIRQYINWSADTYFPGQVSGIGDQVKDYVFVVNNYFYNWGHQFIHNPGSLTLLLNKSGFRNINPVKIYDSRSSDLCNLETHGKVIPEAYNEMETMIFEATK